LKEQVKINAWKKKKIPDEHIGKPGLKHKEKIQKIMPYKRVSYEL